MASLRETIEQLRQRCHTASDLAALSYRGVSKPEELAFQTQGFALYRGKVRDVVIRPNDLLILHTDRLTAFDRFIAMVPYKGFILCELTKWWFNQATDAGITNHYLHPAGGYGIEARKLTPVKAEVVVRRYLAGSLQRAYDKGERQYCGASLPDGLTPFAKLPEPIITPTTKAAAFEHDENSSPAELIERGICSQDEWADIATQALGIFAWGEEWAARSGWILADTKYEFGRSDDGKIILMDEIHTPDSSRFWTLETFASRLKAGQAPEMFDKENVRRHLLGKGFQGHGDVPDVPASVLLDLASTYLTFAERLIGKTLETPPPRA